LILAPPFFADTAFWIALFRQRDQYHREARAWREYVVRSETALVTTEAICWEWMNAMSGTATRRVAAQAYERLRLDPQIDVVPFSEELSAGALRLFADRSDKDRSLTDCLSFMVMGGRCIQKALTADHHFEQAGFRPILSDAPPVT
jgi:predicted nucleic acid-binding protein